MPTFSFVPVEEKGSKNGRRSRLKNQEFENFATILDNILLRHLLLTFMFLYSLFPPSVSVTAPPPTVSSPDKQC